MLSKFVASPDLKLARNVHKAECPLLMRSRLHFAVLPEVTSLIQSVIVCKATGEIVSSIV